MFTIIGKRFTPEAFAAYVAGIALDKFKPSFVVLHNTGVPNLAQRPNGWTEGAIKTLHNYYSKEKAWSGGPHLFIDDKPDGIVVFNPLDDAGVHSPSWNGVAWGVEMLGDYSKDDFASGRGAKVGANAAAAVAVLLSRIKTEPNGQTIRLHKEDKKTTHACPGAKVDKTAFVAAVKARMKPGVPLPSTDWNVVIGDKSREVEAGETDVVRFVGESLGAVLSVDGDTHTIIVTPSV